jgi:hypothetical protein
MRAADIKGSFVGVWLVFGLTAGCIGENEAVVFVDPRIEGPAATVSSSALGTSLSGSFHLSLVLGPRASGSSQVSLIQLSITSADEKTAIVPSLEVTASRSLPVTVAPDSEVGVDFTFDTGANLLPASAMTALCTDPGISITGTVQDSLQDGATPVASAVFKPAGCT